MATVLRKFVHFHEEENDCCCVYLCHFSFFMSRMHLLWLLKLVRYENQRTRGRVFQQQTLACSSEHPLSGRPVHMKLKDTGYLQRDGEIAKKWKGLIHQTACTVTGTHTFMLFHNRRGCRPNKKWSCSIWILVFQIHTLGSFRQFWGLMWEHRGWKWVLCVDGCDVFVMILH